MAKYDRPPAYLSAADVEKGIAAYKAGSPHAPGASVEHAFQNEASAAVEKGMSANFHRIEGEIAPVRGGLLRRTGELGTDVAKTVVDTHAPLIAGRVGGLARGLGKGLGYTIAGAFGGPKLQAAADVVFHGETVADLAAQAAKQAAGSVIKRAIPWLGIGLAASDVLRAGAEGKKAYQAEMSAEKLREATATKYASPLVHQQRLRAMYNRPGPKLSPGMVGSEPKPVAPVALSRTTTPVTDRKPLTDFGRAFSAARKAAVARGEDPSSSTFSFGGKSYSTRVAGEKRVKRYDPNKDISNIAMLFPWEN